jgi:homoserine O-acetyltransferase
MHSVGVVLLQLCTLEEGIQLESGEILSPITVAYEIYGEMNVAKDNVVLIAHALSGDAHVAGTYANDDNKEGWWDMMIGPSKAFDTDRYCVICSNVLGGCKGTTGPQSIDPKTNKAYGMNFPIVTIGDMVNVQRQLLNHLGISRLKAVVGGSMGGMQALEWAVHYPDDVESIMVIASTSRLSSQSIAFNEVGRHAIMSDEQWKKGRYSEDNPPEQGLAIARMIGHITYLSEEAMHRKFGRRLQEKESLGFDFGTDFEVESYLKYQGHRFVAIFDANSYLYMTKAMDYFDLSKSYESLEKAFERVIAKVLVVSFSSDWLFPPGQSEDIVHAFMKNGKRVSYSNVSTDSGHDAFLIEQEPLQTLMKGFLDHV